MHKVKMLIFNWLSISEEARKALLAKIRSEGMSEDDVAKLMSVFDNQGKTFSLKIKILKLQMLIQKQLLSLKSFMNEIWIIESDNIHSYNISWTNYLVQSSLHHITWCSNHSIVSYYDNCLINISQWMSGISA